MIPPHLGLFFLHFLDPASWYLKLEYVQNFFRTSLHKTNTFILEVLLYIASLKLSLRRGRGLLENAILMKIYSKLSTGFSSEYYFPTTHPHTHLHPHPGKFQKNNIQIYTQTYRYKSKLGGSETWFGMGLGPKIWGFPNIQIANIKFLIFKFRIF